MMLTLPRSKDMEHLPAPLGKDLTFHQLIDMQKNTKSISLNMDEKKNNDFDLAGYSSEDEDAYVPGARPISPCTFRDLAKGCQRWDMKQYEELTAGEVSLNPPSSISAILPTRGKFRVSVACGARRY